MRTREKDIVLKLSRQVPIQKDERNDLFRRERSEARENLASLINDWQIPSLQRRCILKAEVASAVAKRQKNSFKQ